MGELKFARVEEEPHGKRLQLQIERTESDGLFQKLACFGIMTARGVEVREAQDGLCS